MADDLATSGLPAVETISLHFDLPGHQIPLSVFVRTAEQTETIIASLFSELAGGELRFELFVAPHERGSFKSKLQIILLGGAAAFWTVLESDIGKSFVAGLTDHEPAYWSEQVALTIREYWTTLYASDWMEKFEEIHHRHACEKIISEVTTRFLQLETGRLERIGVTTTRFRDAFEARNEFYQACMQHPELQGIGFSDEPRFPVRRVDFATLQVTLPPKEDEDEPWLTGVTVLKVTSPNWDRDDRHRQWKGKDAKGRERFFWIEDDHFWTLVKTEQLSIHIIDTIKVQWAYHGTSDFPRRARVLRVLEFNEQTLSLPLDEKELDSMLGRHVPIKDEQSDLFD